MSKMMQQIVLASRPDGVPTPDNFRVEEIPMPAPGKDEFLAEIIYLSLDPYMRGRMDAGKSYAAGVEIGHVMEAGAVARVIESNYSRFAVGEFVETRFGWKTHAVHDGRGVRKIDPRIAPISTAVGVLGMPGMTAYTGLKVHGRPVAGETLVVSAATGAVGSLVGQLGKIWGLRVIGVAGGSEKCAYAIDELGFDACIDHRSDTLHGELKEACPDGIDIYFENVGGKTLESVIGLMNVFGRIPVCGMISWYNLGGLGNAGIDGQDQSPRLWRSILVNRLSVRGFIITDHYDSFPEFLTDVSGYLVEGKIKFRETIAEGIEAAPKAFIDMLGGGNFGKQLVRLAPDPSL